MPRDIINLDDVYLNTLGTFKVIITSDAPFIYPDAFFNELFPTKRSRKQVAYISQLAYFGEIAVGAVKAKIVSNAANGDPDGVYVDALVVLKAYQNKGIGKKLLEYVEASSIKNNQRSLYTHVDSGNIQAIEWFERQGFEKQESQVNSFLYQPASAGCDVLLLKKQL